MPADFLPISPQALPIISDIHGHSQGLRKVLKRLVDLRIQTPPLVLGDLIWNEANDRQPIEVLNILMDMPLTGIVRGNTDQWVLDMCETSSSEPTVSSLGRLTPLNPKHIDFLRSLPIEFPFTYMDQRMLAVHASPLDIEVGLTLDMNLPDFQKYLADRQAEILLTGHLHRSFVRVINGWLHYSIGAVAKHPKDIDTLIEFAILDFTPTGTILISQSLLLDGVD